MLVMAFDLALFIALAIHNTHFSIFTVRLGADSALLLLYDIDGIR